MTTMNNEDPADPSVHEQRVIGEIVGTRHTPTGTGEFWGYWAEGYKPVGKVRVVDADQMREAIAAGRGSGEPIAMLHDDGHWTHPPGRDPLDRFSGKVRMEVYAAPQPPHEPLTEEQIDSAIAEHVDPIATYGRLVAFARAIERAHNIRSASSDAVHRSRNEQACRPE